MVDENDEVLDAIEDRQAGEIARRDHRPRRTQNGAAVFEPRGRGERHPDDYEHGGLMRPSARCGTRRPIKRWRRNRPRARCIAGASPSERHVGELEATGREFGGRGGGEGVQDRGHAAGSARRPGDTGSSGRDPAAVARCRLWRPISGWAGRAHGITEGYMLSNRATRPATTSRSSTGAAAFRLSKASAVDDIEPNDAAAGRKDFGSRQLSSTCARRRYCG